MSLVLPTLLVPKGTVRHRARVIGISAASVILPPGTVPPPPPPPEEEMTGEREGRSEVIDIPMGTDETIDHVLDFLHPGRAPQISLAILGLDIRGRTTEAERLQRELEKGPEKGQGKGGLEKEQAEQDSVNVRLTVAWPPGHTHSNERNDAVLFQTIEKGEETGNYLEWEEVGPGSWGFSTWFGSTTTNNHEKLTLTTQRVEGLAEVDVVKVQLRISETWNATPAPPPAEPQPTTGTIMLGASTRGVVDKQHGAMR